MNYIREINAFYDWLEINELTKPAVLLWHALMHLNNKAGWRESFTVARSVIEAKTGLKKDAYYKARNLLKQNGLLDFKERGTKATVFRLKPLSSVLQTTNETTSETRSQTTVQTRSQTVTKLNETKSSSSSTSEEEVFQFYQQNIQNGVSSSPYVLQNIQHWIDDITADLVLAAMKVAANKEKRGFDYVEGILKKWTTAGVKSLEDARKYELEFKEASKVTPFRKKNKLEPQGRAIPDGINLDFTAGED